MSMRSLFVFAIAAAAVLSPPTARAGDDRLAASGWTIGALASGTTDHLTASGLHDKLRLGGLPLAGLPDGAALRPWTDATSGPGGGRHAAGGLLLDVPVGGFTFTPSIGAYRANGAVLSGAPSVAMRSQLELGYQFDNSSRVALGFTRTSGVGAGDPRDDGDMISLSVRLPFGNLLNW